MAEENHHVQLADEISHDDMSVMTTLLRTVKGISFISTPPLLEEVGIDD